MTSNTTDSNDFSADPSVLSQSGGGSQASKMEFVQIEPQVLPQKKPRSIGRWRICETLGKGGYSWVKKGLDKKTGKCVALKFMKKADKTWAKEQDKQVVTEIECLKQVRHQNVLKLYAYNLNAKYPTSEAKKIDAILLVLEYAPAGEIFDILYYTRALEPILARTYFRQAILGLEACHMANIAHRDVKPQNLLLDARFNLKICDFGLSKIFESDADSLMKTTYVGTRGYQAPELLQNKIYDLSCDVFSLGVVMFILINGYPPFEQASLDDRWFKPLVSGDTKKFWKLHRQCAIRKDDKCKDLLVKMLTFDPKNRITIAEIKSHPWLNEPVLQGKDLIRALKVRHKEMEIRRQEDGRKAEDLQTSVPIQKAIDFGECKECTQYPQHDIEGVNDNEQYSFIGWKEIFEIFKVGVSEMAGDAVFDTEDNALLCVLKPMTNMESNVEDLIKFEVRVFLSREFPVSEQELSDIDKDAKPQVYVVRLTKTEGNTNMWTKIKDKLLLRCRGAVNGLPEWATKKRSQQLQANDDEKETEKDEEDNYLDNEEITWEVE